MNALLLVILALAVIGAAGWIVAIVALSWLRRLNARLVALERQQAAASERVESLLTQLLARDNDGPAIANAVLSAIWPALTGQFAPGHVTTPINRNGAQPYMPPDNGATGAA